MLTIAGAALLATTACAPETHAASASAPVASAEQQQTNRIVDQRTLSQRLNRLQGQYGARIGLFALDTLTDQVVGFNEDHRFGYASSIKALLAAFFLERVTGESRGEQVTWTQEQVDDAGYAPVTGEHVGERMSVQELAEATVRTSDNLAFNLVLEKLGGPDAFQQWLRDQGDQATEFASYEPFVNDIVDGDTANTSTPASMTSTLAQVVTSLGRESADQDLLVEWMSGNATGDTLLRAGVPAGWTVADKSGGAAGMRNDIAVITQHGQDPVIVSVLTTKRDPKEKYDDQLLADVAEALFAD
ncbi:class A beta-lactamase [Leucobacter musarum]|uniref:class A beta-lactamase n=1 Tax=Leucobacter musarum TaxID=1930747 RepID=UPI0006A77FB7|nr:class A beta-lactamase [Leucobacter musarum]